MEEREGICWKGEAKPRAGKISHNQPRNKEKQVVKVVQKKELECEEGKLPGRRVQPGWGRSLPPGNKRQDKRNQPQVVPEEV